MPFFLSFFSIPKHVPLILFVFPSVYRFYTSVLFHGCLLHVLFSILALVSGTELERIMGSVCLLFLMFLLATTNAILPNFGWQEAVTLIFLHVSELWQKIFCRFVSFLVHMLTLYFLSIMETLLFI
jgi:membrane associated rhomboid family serine protease